MISPGRGRQVQRHAIVPHASRSLHEPNAFYLRGSDGVFASTPATAGPWGPGSQHGGPPAALLVRAFELTEPQPLSRIARFAMEFLRPVPVAPLTVRTALVRRRRRGGWAGGPARARMASAGAGRAGSRRAGRIYGASDPCVGTNVRVAWRAHGRLHERDRMAPCRRLARRAGTWRRLDTRRAAARRRRGNIPVRARGARGRFGERCQRLGRLFEVALYQRRPHREPSPRPGR